MIIINMGTHYSFKEGPKTIARLFTTIPGSLYKLVTPNSTIKIKESKHPNGSNMSINEKKYLYGRRFIKIFQTGEKILRVKKLQNKITFHVNSKTPIMKIKLLDDLIMLSFREIPPDLALHLHAGLYYSLNMEIPTNF
ncbi:MAG: hypothetical protein ACXQS8_07885 [Candidatus Helarchaeales archaeon]